jgi:predicted AAA+ superfamily ATPase
LVRHRTCFCIETLIAAAPTGTEPFFYRTAAGAELDLVLRLPRGALWAIEIKRTTAPKVSRGFHLAVQDIRADRRILVYAGARDVPAGDGHRAMSLATAVEQLRNP